MAELLVLGPITAENPDAQQMVDQGRAKEVLEITEPVADNICDMSIKADDWEEMTLVLAIAYETQGSMQDLYGTPQNFGRFAIAAVDWRCPTADDHWTSP